MLSGRFAALGTWCRATFHKNRFFAHRSPWASLARLRHRSLHLGVSRGDLGAHPRCSDSPPRFVPEGRYRGSCTYWPTADPLVRNSHRGWTPRSLSTIRSAGRKAVGRRAGSRSGFASSARPARTSGLERVFGAHPRGEFPTSGAAVGQIRTWAAVAAFPVRNAKGCLSSEGGHRRLRAVTSKHRKLCAVTSGPAAA